jgi:hypothetical protein
VKKVGTVYPVVTSGLSLQNKANLRAVGEGIQKDHPALNRLGSVWRSGSRTERLGAGCCMWPSRPRLGIRAAKQSQTRRMGSWIERAGP